MHRGRRVGGLTLASVWGGNKSFNGKTLTGWEVIHLSKQHRKSEMDVGMKGESGIYNKLDNNQVKIYSLSQSAQKGRIFLWKDKTVYTKRRDPKKGKKR